ncbi:MAG: magnesium transporter MgtE [Selenomonadaceae bacterium]|nr:magnesium transporter MgtE [Selenomonadaceae bacterium]
MATEEEEYEDEYDEEEEEEPKKHRILKLLLILLLLIVLIVGGFALGIYLRIFDAQEANEKLGLYNLPVIGQYFVKPAPTEEDMQNTPAEDVKPDPDADKKDAKDSKKVQLSKKEIEKQMKERDAAERKRVSKLARLYNEMKPADAASAMDELDDDMCIAILQRMDEGQAAKVLTEFDPSKTARLTKIMYEGTKKKLNSPSDIQKMIEQGQDAGQADAQTAAQAQ